MVIVKVLGGLGNQMFQYAYAKSLQSLGHNVKIDNSSFDTYTLHGGYQLDKYDIDLEIASRDDILSVCKGSIGKKILRVMGIGGMTKVKESGLIFDNRYLNIGDCAYVKGYFQSELYFRGVREALIRQFSLHKVSSYTKVIENQILNESSSCSLHVRRGDFINSVNIDIHGFCGVDYYMKSIDLISAKFKDTRFFVFSDDMNWVKKHLAIKNAVYLDSKDLRDPHEDIYLMSLCKNNIIANSSFSWWGAWINKNKQKNVIAPRKWFEDNKLQKESKTIVCGDWTKV
jgi:hypothetical protein